MQGDILVRFRLLYSTHLSNIIARRRINGQPCAGDLRAHAACVLGRALRRRARRTRSGADMAQLDAYKAYRFERIARQEHDTPRWHADSPQRRRCAVGCSDGASVGWSACRTGSWPRIGTYRYRGPCIDACGNLCIEALVLPTSLCSGQIALQIAQALNAQRERDGPSGALRHVSRFVALPHTEGLTTVNMREYLAILRMWGIQWRQ